VAVPQARLEVALVHLDEARAARVAVARRAGRRVGRLELAAPSRVVLDATGSSLATTISVRKGPSCPGAEVPLGCSAAIAGRPSFLDLQLAAGTYFVQVDGLGGASGAWTLDVHVAPQ
jgi:hypothetical protein